MILLTLTHALKNTLYKVLTRHSSLVTESGVAKLRVMFNSKLLKSKEKRDAYILNRQVPLIFVSGQSPVHSLNSPYDPFSRLPLLHRTVPLKIMCQYTDADYSFTECTAWPRHTQKFRHYVLCRHPTTRGTDRHCDDDHSEHADHVIFASTKRSGECPVCKNPKEALKIVCIAPQGRTVRQF